MNIFNFRTKEELVEEGVELKTIPQIFENNNTNIDSTKVLKYVNLLNDFENNESLYDIDLEIDKIKKSLLESTTTFSEYTTEVIEKSSDFLKNAIQEEKKEFQEEILKSVEAEKRKILESVEKSLQEEKEKVLLKIANGSIVLKEIVIDGVSQGIQTPSNIESIFNEMSDKLLKKTEEGIYSTIEELKEDFAKKLPELGEEITDNFKEFTEDSFIELLDRMEDFSKGILNTALNKIDLSKVYDIVNNLSEYKPKMELTIFNLEIIKEIENLKKNKSEQSILEIKDLEKKLFEKNKNQSYAEIYFSTLNMKQELIKKINEVNVIGDKFKPFIKLSLITKAFSTNGTSLIKPFTELAADLFVGEVLSNKGVYNNNDVLKELNDKYIPSKDREILNGLNSNFKGSVEEKIAVGHYFEEMDFKLKQMTLSKDYTSQIILNFKEMFNGAKLFIESFGKTKEDIEKKFGKLKSEIDDKIEQYSDLYDKSEAEIERDLDILQNLPKYIDETSTKFFSTTRSKYISQEKRFNILKEKLENSFNNEVEETEKLIEDLENSFKEQEIEIEKMIENTFKTIETSNDLTDSVKELFLNIKNDIKDQEKMDILLNEVLKGSYDKQTIKIIEQLNSMQQSLIQINESKNQIRDNVTKSFNSIKGRLEDIKKTSKEMHDDIKIEVEYIQSEFKSAFDEVKNFRKNLKEHFMGDTLNLFKTAFEDYKIAKEKIKNFNIKSFFDYKKTSIYKTGVKFKEKMDNLFETFNELDTDIDKKKYLEIIKYMINDFGIVTNDNTKDIKLENYIILMKERIETKMDIYNSYRIEISKSLNEYKNNIEIINSEEIHPLLREKKLKENDLKFSKDKLLAKNNFIENIKNKLLILNENKTMEELFLEVNMDLGKGNFGDIDKIAFLMDKFDIESEIYRDFEMLKDDISDFRKDIDGVVSVDKLLKYNIEFDFVQNEENTYGKVNDSYKFKLNEISGNTYFNSENNLLIFEDINNADTLINDNKLNGYIVDKKNFILNITNIINDNIDNPEVLKKIEMDFLKSLEILNAKKIGYENLHDVNSEEIKKKVGILNKNISLIEDSIKKIEEIIPKFKVNTTEINNTLWIDKVLDIYDKDNNIKNEHLKLFKLLEKYPEKQNEIFQKYLNKSNMVINMEIQDSKLSDMAIQLSKSELRQQIYEDMFIFNYRQLSPKDKENNDKEYQKMFLDINQDLNIRKSSLTNLNVRDFEILYIKMDKTEDKLHLESLKKKLEIFEIINKMKNTHSNKFDFLEKLYIKINNKNNNNYPFVKDILLKINKHQNLVDNRKDDEGVLDIDINKIMALSIFEIKKDLVEIEMNNLDDLNLIDTLSILSGKTDNALSVVHNLDTEDISNILIDNHDISKPQEELSIREKLRLESSDLLLSTYIDKDTEKGTKLKKEFLRDYIEENITQQENKILVMQDRQNGNGISFMKKIKLLTVDENEKVLDMGFIVSEKHHTIDRYHPDYEKKERKMKFEKGLGNLYKSKNQELTTDIIIETGNKLKQKDICR